MPKHFLQLIFLTFIIPFVGCGQNSETSKGEVVPVSANWSKGENITYKISKGTQEYLSDSMQSDKKFSYNMTLTVENETENGYDLTANYSGWSNVFPFELSGKLPGNKALDTKFPSVLVKYNVDKMGKFLGISNAAELAVESNKFIEALQKDISFIKLDVAFRNDIIASLKAYATEESIKNDLFSDLSLLHSYFGLTFKIDSTLTYNDKRDNIWNGPKLPVTEDISAVWIDTSLLKIERNTYFDEIETNKSVQNYIKTIMKNDTTGQSKMRDYQVVVVDKMTHLLDPMSGWVYLLRSIRTLSDSSKKDNVDYLIYEVQK